MHLGNDPQFAEDLHALETHERAEADAVLDFGAVTFLNSSNLAGLLRVRKQMLASDRKLVLCGVNTPIWGTFLTTGLDKVFRFSDDVTTSLATLQMT